MASATVAPSFTVTGPGTVTTGASATGVTVTAMVCAAEVAVEVPSLEAAVTDSTMLVSPAVTVRPASWPAVSVQLPLWLLVPADNVASLATPLIVTDPSVSSASAAMSVMASATVAPSFTVTGPGTVTTGASATGVTVTAMVCAAEVAVEVPSLEAAVTDSTMLVSPAVTVTPASCAAVRVQLPLWLLVPADSVASLATPLIVTDPSVSSASAAMSVMASATVAPSFTVTGPGTVTTGASATGVTVTAMVCAAEVAVEVPSPEAAVTDSTMLVSPAVTVRPASWPAVSVQLPL